MGLSADEQATLDALTAKASEPDDDSDFEIEIYNPAGNGARVPYSKGRSWLQREFGIDLDPDPAAATDSGSGSSTDRKSTKAAKGDKPPADPGPPPAKRGLFPQSARP
jgi:hypothetical protein